MLEFIGKYTSCTVMTDSIEQEAVTQIYNFLNCPAFEGAKIVIQPDVHAGKGAVIGFTSTLTDKIIPNVIGVDVGCGILAYCLGDIPCDETLFKNLDKFIRKNIPSGFSVHAELDRKIDETADDYRKVAKETNQDESRVIRSLGTIGGGNHFCELDQDVESKNIWLTIHSGSRNFGLKICEFHQLKAVKTSGKGHGLEWLEGEEADYYLQHMVVAQRYAAENRTLIAKKIIESFFGFKLKNLEFVESVHNYINLKDRIIRKGATSAHAGERLVIPFNMRDGIILGRGKGNSDWNFSAPHGAGRVMGRGQAKRTLDLDEFKNSMEGIWTSCVSKDTLDESPMVYKDHEMIRECIKDTVDIELTLKPLYNFKAGRENE